MKRLMDLTLSIVMLLLCLPLLLILAVVIKNKLGGPIVFRQIRPGYKGKPFEMYKFRTMTNQTDAHGDLLPDEQRMTPFGQWLRASSLDELPELWNVLKGDMSFVGPRPLLMEYLPLYNEIQFKRHDVLPGITGWAQINGRNSSSWQAKFNDDVWYVEHRTLWLDIKILFLTVFKVLKKEGINQEGHVTSGKFMGNKS